jgi:uncharacterized protein
MEKARTVACPRCGAAVLWNADAPWRPFCSERCRNIDQGAWASGSYRLPAVDPPDDFELAPPPDDD